MEVNDSAASFLFSGSSFLISSRVKKIYSVFLVYISSPPLLRAESRVKLTSYRHVELKGRVWKCLEGNAASTRLDHYGNKRYSDVPPVAEGFEL